MPLNTGYLSTPAADLKNTYVAQVLRLLLYLHADGAIGEEEQLLDLSVATVRPEMVSAVALLFQRFLPEGLESHRMRPLHTQPHHRSQAPPPANLQEKCCFELSSSCSRPPQRQKAQTALVVSHAANFRIESR